MYKFAALFSIFSLIVSGSAAANQPFEINVKFKVEGAIERVDMGVFALCEISQRQTDVSLPPSRVWGAVQLLAPAEFFSNKNGDGTISGTVKISTDSTFDLIDGNRRDPRIYCSLKKGVPRDILEHSAGAPGYSNSITIQPPAAAGSCVRSHAVFDLATQSPREEKLICD